MWNVENKKRPGAGCRVEGGSRRSEVGGVKDEN